MPNEISVRVNLPVEDHHDEDFHNVSVMTLIPKLEELMVKHHMKKYQAALNDLRSDS